MQVYQDWMDEWMVFDPGNWHLKDNAPASVVKKFNEYMKQEEDTVS